MPDYLEVYCAFSAQFYILTSFFICLTLFKVKSCYQMKDLSWTNNLTEFEKDSLTLHKMVHFAKNKIGVVYFESCVIFDTL